VAYEPQPPRIEVLKVIRVSYLIGRGVEGDPLRSVDDFYQEDGTLIAHVDLWAQAPTQPTLRREA
jgi:hypothetical protein